MRIFLLALLLLTLTACVQSPTRSTEVVDDRPGVAFELQSSAAKMYELKVDGVSYGKISQYQAGKSRLRIVDGSHTLELFVGNKKVFSEQVYLGAGTNKIIKVGDYE